MKTRVCLQVTARGVTAAKCGDSGQFEPGFFLPGNAAFNNLDEAVRFFDGDDYRLTHTVVVWDCLFPGGGMYCVQHGQSMYGYAGWNLHEVVGDKEQEKRHEDAVQAAASGHYNEHVHRPAIVVAFERVEVNTYRMLCGDE